MVPFKGKKKEEIRLLMLHKGSKLTHTVYQKSDLFLRKPKEIPRCSFTYSQSCEPLLKVLNLPSRAAAVCLALAAQQHVYFVVFPLFLNKFLQRHVLAV